MAIDGGLKVIDANKQAIAYVYGHADERDAEITNSMTLDEARRLVANITKLPTFLAAQPYWAGAFQVQSGSARL